MNRLEVRLDRHHKVSSEGRMTQMDVLVASVAELLAGAVHEVLRLMGQAVSEYREESTRIHQENQKLQRTLEELRAKLQGSDAVQQVSAAAEEPLYESPLINLSEWSLEPWASQKNHVMDPSSRLGQERPIPPRPGAETQPQNIPRSPAPDLSQSRSRFLDPGSKSVSPVVTETPGAFSGIKTESKLPELTVAEVSGFEPRAYSPLHHDPSPSGDAPRGTPDLSRLIKQAERRDTHCCSVCGKSFSTAHHLSLHSVCHSGERPHACAHCRFRFTRLSDLKKHERIHTGERPYNCSLCGRRFNRTGNLCRHMRKVHHGTPV